MHVVVHVHCGKCGSVAGIGDWNPWCRSGPVAKMKLWVRGRRGWLALCTWRVVHSHDYAFTCHAVTSAASPQSVPTAPFIAFPRVLSSQAHVCLPIVGNCGNCGLQAVRPKVVLDLDSHAVRYGCTLTVAAPPLQAYWLLGLPLAVLLGLRLRLGAMGLWLAMGGASALQVGACGSACGSACGGRARRVARWPSSTCTTCAACRVLATRRML